MAAVKFSATPSWKIFAPADAQPPHRALRPQLDELVHLLLAARAVPEEVALRAHGQLAPLGERAVGRERLRVHGGVLPGGDPERVQLRLGEADALLPLLGRRFRHEPLHERPSRPRAASRGARRRRRARCGRPDGSAVAASDAGELERAGVHPRAVPVAVLEEDGPVGDDCVEVARLGVPPGNESIDQPSPTIHSRSG